MVQKTAGSRRGATRKCKGKSHETVLEVNSSPSSSLAAAGVGGSIGNPRKRYMGVRQSPSGRWVAEIKATAQKIRMWLGTFDTAETAARAYDEAACLLRGANTRTNFWPRSGGTGPISSVLPAKVLKHILGHLEIQRAAETRSFSSSSHQPPPSIPLPPPPPPPTLQQPQLQLQFNDQLEIEPIARIAYGELLSDVSISGSSHSGEENEFSASYCNMGVRFHGGMKVVEEEEVDMELRTLEQELSRFYEPFQMAMAMEDERSKSEMGTYEYWLMLSTAEKIF